MRHRLAARFEPAIVERIADANRQRTWGASTVNSWYKNEKGHVTQNWPFNLSSTGN